MKILNKINISIFEKFNKLNNYYKIKGSEDKMVKVWDANNG